MNNIYLIVGASGSGKTRITSELVKRYGFKNLQSYTTRPIRKENEYGHIFITDEDFDKLKDILAYTYYEGNRYCSTLEQIEENDLYVIDIDGINYFKNKYNGNKGIKIIAIDAPLDLRIMRMKIRGDLDEKIELRVKVDSVVFKDLKKNADIVFENNDLDTTVKNIYDYICYQERGI